MEHLKSVNLVQLETAELNETRGGNPVLIAMGVVTSVVSFGKAIDKASEWFLEGWNNPK